MLVLAAVGIPLSLLWDFSWESTIGIDQMGSPPHVSTYLAVALAGFAAISMAAPNGGVRFLWRSAPLGAWIALWGAAAYFVAFLFDRWWQANYGLAAGIWHPPQLLKAAAFFAVTCGAWLGCAPLQKDAAGALRFAIAGGAVLALIFLVALPAHFANRQHSAPFYQIACATYPIVLAALAKSARLRWPATTGALAGMLLVAVMVWLLPLVPGLPLVAPIYHPRDHLLPPPFPPLLIVPALAMDLLLRVSPKHPERAPGWGQAIESGLGFFLVFLAVQWPFSSLLLSPAADHWFFAGGGMQWPFFLRIVPGAETAFWKTSGDEFTLTRALIAAGLAVLATRIGLWLGAWMQRVRR